MTSRLSARVRLPDAEAFSVGFGLLAAAGLLVAPLVVGPPTFADDVRVFDVPPGAWLAAAALIVAIAGIADLLGRTELRQGIGVLGAAGLFAAGALLFFSIRAVLGADGPAELEPLVPYAVLAVWASALVVGTVAWGPTRTAVLIGLVTIALALLLPIGPESQPFLGYALDSGSSYVLVPAGAAVLVAAWRLLDLPRIGGIVLGGGLAVFTQVWLQGAPPAGIPCPGVATTCLQPTDVQSVIWAACLFVAFGALFGLPGREA
jgi:hypothetical protein